MTNTVDYKQGFEDGIQPNCPFMPNGRTGEALEAYAQGYNDGVDATDPSNEYYHE